MSYILVPVVWAPSCVSTAMARLKIGKRRTGDQGREIQLEPQHGQPPHGQPEPRHVSRALFSLLYLYVGTYIECRHQFINTVYTWISLCI